MGANLKERVNGRANSTGAEVATRDEDMTLGQYIKQMEDQFAAAMPQGVEAKQLVRDALTALRTTRNLDRCDRLSVLGGLMTCAQLNLRVGVLGHAWLLPFWDKNRDNGEGKRKGGHRAQLVIGYQGYRELAQRSGQIASLVGRVVYENDEYDVEYGLDERLFHKRRRGVPRGEATDYYVIVKYVNGGRTFWDMSKEEVEEHRDRFAMAKGTDKETGEKYFTGPWRDDFDAMAMKTAFLKLAKWMPKSTELAAAIAADGTVRVDLTPNPDAMFHGERPDADDAIDGEVVEATHANGHGLGQAWSSECDTCRGDTAGEAHFNAHVEPEESCTYCAREAAWKQGRS